MGPFFVFFFANYLEKKYLFPGPIPVGSVGLLFPPPPAPLLPLTPLLSRDGLTPPSTALAHTPTPPPGGVRADRPPQPPHPPPPGSPPPPPLPSGALGAHHLRARKIFDFGLQTRNRES